VAPERLDPLLVLRAQAGDREALDALLRALQQPLYRYIRGLTGRSDLAEDVLQEVFLRVFRKLRWLREPELVRPWVYRIATREAYRHLRRDRRRAERTADVDDIVDLPVEPELPTDGLLESLTELAQSISPASRAVLLLHYVQGLTIDEAAEALDIPVGTAKSRLAYGLHVLRKRLQDSPQKGTP
jgi:RNA polymerase sigma-70 factor (ECF subfamily)